MSNYETLVLFAEDTSEETQKKLVDSIASLIEKNNGSVKNSESWGKKTLAFQIDQSKSGFYWLLNFEAGPTVPKKLNDWLRIEDSVIRCLIAQADAPSVVKKPLKKVEPKKKMAETFIR